MTLDYIQIDELQEPKMAVGSMPKNFVQLPKVQQQLKNIKMERIQTYNCDSPEVLF